jgi:hypothetical protein
MLIQSAKPTNTLSKKYKIGAITFFFTFLSLTPPLTSYAATTSSPNYSIEMDQIDTSNPEPTSPPPLVHQQINAIMSAGSKNHPIDITSSQDSFSVNLSQDFIDFGPLSATNPVIRTSDISFTSPARGAKVLLSENRQLMTTEKNIIPDTSCDNGACSHILPANWSSNLTYGFGFRCESSLEDVCDTSFSNSDNFKQFADTSANELPQTIILSNQSKLSTQSRIIYKVNISGTQAVGGYSNTITYLAVPNF